MSNLIMTPDQMRVEEFKTKLQELQDAYKVSLVPFAHMDSINGLQLGCNIVPVQDAPTDLKGEGHG